MFTCSYCQQDSAGNHTWNCPMNPININNNEFQLNKAMQYKLNYYNVYWLETALNNFKNQSNIIQGSDLNLSVKEFIKKWAREELDKIVDIK